MGGVQAYMLGSCVAIRVGPLWRAPLVGPLGGHRGSRLNLFISGTETSIMMIEGEADFLTEEQMTAAIDLGMSVIRQLCRGLKAFANRSMFPPRMTDLAQAHGAWRMAHGA
jgi:hypothetical protein